MTSEERSASAPGRAAGRAACSDRYAALEERILDRDQLGASEVYYGLLREGRPLDEMLLEAVRIHGPYTHVPYHERIDDGFVNFVNNDHCLLSARATLNLVRMLPPEAAGLAMAQSAALALRSLDPAGGRPSPPPDLSVVVAKDAAGRQRPLAKDGPVLVLVFDPECAHTERAAPAWRDWLRTAGPDLRVVALSGTTHAVASAYAARAGWPVPVLTVAEGVRGSPQQAVVSRTPWVFALDAAGNVRGRRAR